MWGLIQISWTTLESLREGNEQTTMIDTLTILFSSTLTDYTEMEQELYLLDMNEWKHKIDKLMEGVSDANTAYTIKCMSR